MTLRLRTRVSLAFGLLSLLVAVVVSLATYSLARVYLTDQREKAAVSRAQVDARYVEASPGADSSEADRLETLPSVGDSQKLVRRNGTWYSSGASVSPGDLPEDLISTAFDGGRGARQRFVSGTTVYLGVAVPVTDGVYVEVFPLDELRSTLRLIATVLAASSALALALGVVLGWFVSSALLRPLRRVASKAGAMTDGDFTVRMGYVADADIAPIADAFDEMAESVEQRIERERRFVANVSHELRTPVTVVLGTAELLESRASGLAPDVVRLVDLLSQQVSRLGRTVLDLLELSSTSSSARVDHDRTDVAALVSDVLDARGLLEFAETPGAGAAVVSTDPRRLERILANLVDNAQTHGRGLVRASVGAEDGEVIVRVEDAGPGVPADEAANIFEPFTRGADAAVGGGAGLGLAIVNEQASAIAVVVSVEEREGGGARFVVRIPRETA